MPRQYNWKMHKRKRESRSRRGGASFSFRQLVALEQNPRKGLLPVEWTVLAYLALTSLVMALCFTCVENPDAMIWLRIRVAVTTFLLWGVYRMLPCRLTILVRVAVQTAMLIWWYPDTYEINRMFPNLDHVFASLEQAVFGFQPALVFSQTLSHPVFSELMDLGYASYYPLIVITMLFFFLFRYNDKMSFNRVSFIIITAFFAYYVIFIFLPVAGPTFYYKAVGMANIAQGVFPIVHDYFNTHQDCLASPGYTNGLFYWLVEFAKASGERPTAAFPSSHVGIGIIVMLIAWRSGSRRLFYSMLPFFVLLFFSTVYIQAHYAVDALAGLVSGAVLYIVLYKATAKMP